LNLPVKRALYLANKSGREKVLIGDLKRALTEGVMPSDKALAQVMAAAEKPARSRRRAFLPAPEFVGETSRQTAPSQRATSLEITTTP
jgi:hypothetical protein